MRETNEFNSLEKSTIPPKVLNCPKVVDENVNYQSNEESVTELQNFKTWNMGRLRAGDCEIRKSDITIYEDGNCNLFIEFHDNGNIFGDHFDLTIKLWAGTEHILTWKFEATLGAGGNREETLRSNEPIPKIKDNFNRIHKVTRQLGCTPDF
ncbi:hypothetical protein [Lysinibacillus fusiformis]|uniref:hypothetical protein n=1 Tax=Lysinibacillus fusiformis TaxID=28031 RepID=UPI0012440A69|nr:hypothetical protein [Lysinibacillus fusiformis]KAB0442620.1 hypothetical protein CH314_12465 [Lysinibacillus fusiformis]